MSDILLVTISFITFSFATLFQRSFLKDSKVNSTVHSIAYQIVIVIIYLFIGIFITGIEIPDLSNHITNLILMGVLYAIAAFSGFAALKGLDASKYIVIITSRGIISVLAASIILDEFLTTEGWIGLILIVAATLIVTVDSKEKLKFKFNKYELYALLGAVAFGLGNVNDRIILEQTGIGIVPYVLISFTIPPIIIGLAKSKELGDFKMYKDKKELLGVVIFGSIIAVSIGTLYAALAVTTNSSVVLSINLLSTVVIVILGIVVLKEHERVLYKILGAMLGLIGFLLTIV